MRIEERVVDLKCRVVQCPEAMVYEVFLGWRRGARAAGIRGRSAGVRRPMNKGPSPQGLCRSGGSKTVMPFC